MKRTLLLATCAAAVLFSIKADAQLGVAKKVVPKVVIGAKLGANFQKMTSSASTWSSSYKPGILGGVFLSVDKKKAGIRVEGLIKSAKFDLSTSGASYKTVALDIPVLWEHKIIKRVWFQVGPQFSSLISAKSSTGADVKGNLRNSDVSAVVGLEGILPMKLTVGARYIYGFVDVNNTTTPGTWKNSSMQFSVGYRFLN